MATASQEERPAVTITNQACGEILIKRVNEIMVSQGKAMDQALQVTRHIVDNYEKQGRLNHLHDHLNDRDWIGKWVTQALAQALAQNPTPHRPVTPATVRTTNRTTSRLPEKKRARSPESSGGPGAPPAPGLRLEDDEEAQIAMLQVLPPLPPPPSGGPPPALPRAVMAVAKASCEPDAAAAWLMMDAAMGAPLPEPKKSSVSKLTLSQYKRGISVCGDTYQVKELLKWRVRGLTWNAVLGVWIGAWSQRERIIAALRACPEVELTVTFDESAEQPKPPEGLCSICHDKPATLALVPCGHQCCCPTCETRLSRLGGNCPVCRASFRGAMKIFRAGA